MGMDVIVWLHGFSPPPAKMWKTNRNCVYGHSSKDCNVVSDRVDTFRIHDMIIAINIDKKRIKSDLSSFVFLRL